MNEGRPKYNPLEHLLMLKNTFRDEIPTEMIDSHTPINNFKVRRNWFQSVVATLANLLDDGEITDQATREEVGKFLKYATSEEFKNKPLTGAEDIAWANRIIDLAVQK